ncbi:MAG: Glu-tRNA(Gln) amidotransferase subunit GatE [Myxococcota bacterium]|jgi:glutamyl-tRNA(Gln) amidotransferase subunit E|nr:Glu-tRNA(Gln) amidotransferase subunit GatE [Myxococcota bacterium]
MAIPFIDPDCADWQALGLMCGVEIHQQLLTQRKLFCRCPAGLYSHHHDAEVVRHMRPTLSELGEYDGTALMEFKTKKNITYLLDRRSVCTYEMDDTPPFEVNREAVEIALEISLALGSNIVGEFHVIRKQYLDGSIPTGFQRTAITGVGGRLPYRGKQIGIIQLSVEEDSCREVSDRGHDIVFRTDRLSMPLVEVVTEPDMHTPQEAADVVRLIGRVMRSTGRVRRGAGASRQDVNVSVRGGTRIEIKGVPSISLIPGLVAGEGVRQKMLLDMREEMLRLGLTPQTFADCRGVDVSYLFEREETPFTRATLRAGGRFMAVRLPGMRDLLSTKVGRTRTFADELGGRVRVIACLDVRPLVVTDDTCHDLGIRDERWRTLRKKLRCKATDAVALAHGPVVDAQCAVAEIVARVVECFEGVPRETRQVRSGGETDFERILPGPDRMYPDTDSPPLAVTDEWLAALAARRRTPVWELDEQLMAVGLPRDVAENLAISPRLPLWQKAVDGGADPKALGLLLGMRWTALVRRGLPLKRIPEGTLRDLFAAAAAGRVMYEALPMLLEDAAVAPERPALELLNLRGLSPMTQAEAARRISDVLEHLARPTSVDPAARKRYYMGKLMPHFFGRLAGVTVERLFDEIMAGAA